VSSISARETLTTGPEGAGARLDQYLADRLPQFSRSRLQQWIRAGHVRVDGEAARPNRRLRAGEAIEVLPPPSTPSRLAPAAIPLEILHRDDHLLVLVKPAGLVVHPGAGTHGPTLVHALLALGATLSGVGGEERPGIVHRLDRDTSGLMLVACSDAAHRALATAFEERRVEKDYRAICWGAVSPRSGLIDLPIGRDPVRRRTMSPRGRKLRDARTRYRTLQSLVGFTYLEIGLETGRTHQIRAHLRSLGHPIVGDREYGGAGWQRVRRPDLREAIRRFDRLALHAFRLRLAHPISGERLEFLAPLPTALATLLTCMGEPGDAS
jgi:23S rRNA pseudouridine1911/1915/1917 synthase